MRYELYTTRHCPNCPPVKEFIREQTIIDGEIISEEQVLKRAIDNKVFSVPTIIFYDDNNIEVNRLSNLNDIKKFININLSTMKL